MRSPTLPDPCQWRDRRKVRLPLAVGDFDNDGIDDLAVAAPEEPSADGTVERVGGVAVFFGNVGGGINTTDFVVQRGDETQSRHSYGVGIVAGDFDGVGGDELLVGATKLGSASDAYVLDFPDNRTNPSQQVLTPAETGLAPPTGQVGWAVAAGDFNNDGYDDGIVTDYKATSSAAPSLVTSQSSTAAPTVWVPRTRSR